MITIIVPCFNEASRLPSEAFISALTANEKLSFLFVDDGSTDATIDVITDMEQRNSSQISHLRLGINKGKAEAVRQGMLHALAHSNQYIGYWDADLATPLDEINTFAQLLETKGSIKIVCGARVQRIGADINRHWYRHYPGRIIATMISMVLGASTYDTQCGAKLLDRTIVEELFNQPFLSPWLFDVEIIARLICSIGKENLHNVLYEHPLSTWHDIGDSKISFSYLPKIPIELAKIYKTYHKKFQ